VSPKKQLLISAALIVFVIASGATGYRLIEGWGWLDALYMTVITITTIGFREVHDLSGEGRSFTMLLILFSLGVVFYSLNNAARLLIEGELKDVFGRKRVQKTIEKLRGHYIVCGYGRMGKIICRELAEKGADFVVIEKEAEVEPAVGCEPLILKGDATKDETLRAAGIENAKGLITVLPTDAENVYVVLSARGLNPSLNIVARAVVEGAEQKLLRAGANRVVSPYHIGGLRIAHTVLKPTVVDFIEFTTQKGEVGLDMVEVPVGGGSALAGKTIGESGIGRELEVIIMAMKKADGTMRINPTHKDEIEEGDTLVVIGEAAKLRALEERARAVAP
jgi:voltage-gated potassium channel